MSAEEYKEKVLEIMLKYEKEFDHVEQWEICDALGCLYECIRAIPTQSELT